jgi:hypothetical protein
MTHYQQLFDITADNYGIATSAQVKEEGISDAPAGAVSCQIAWKTPSALPDARAT